MLEAEGKRVSLRKIASWTGVPWSTMQYKPRRRSTPPVDKNVEHAIYELIQRYPRYGYRRIVVMLRRKMNLVVNRKKVQRIMQRNGWGVKIRFKGFRPRTRSLKSVSESLNHRWATDMTHFFCRDAEVWPSSENIFKSITTIPPREPSPRLDLQPLTC